MYKNSLQRFSNFLEQWCFEVIDVSKYRTKLLTQKNLKILEGNEERMHAQANSSHRNIRFHYACLLEGLGRRRSLACTSGSTGIKMSIVDIVSARRRRAGLSRGRNLTNKTKPRVLAGKWRWRGEKRKKCAGSLFDVSPEGKFCSLSGCSRSEALIYSLKYICHAFLSGSS